MTTSTPTERDADYGVSTGRDSVVFDRLLPGPIERVWAYLTESDKRAQWFAAGTMDLRVGGKVELIFRNAELAPPGEPIPERYKQHSGEIHSSGRITRCEPPRVLSFVWGEGDDSSDVTFELSPQGEQVRLVLTHSRLKDRAAKVDVSGGWHLHLDVLADQLCGREQRPFWSKLERIEAEYGGRHPA